MKYLALTVSQDSALLAGGRDRGRGLCGKSGMVHDHLPISTSSFARFSYCPLIRQRD